MQKKSYQDMMRLSIGTRWPIVTLMVHAGWSLHRIAQYFNVSLAVVRCILQTFEEKEDVEDRQEYGLRAHGIAFSQSESQSNRVGSVWESSVSDFPEILRTSSAASWKDGTLNRNIRRLINSIHTTTVYVCRFS